MLLKNALVSYLKKKYISKINAHIELVEAEYLQLDLEFITIVSQLCNKMNHPTMFNEII